MSSHTDQLYKNICEIIEGYLRLVSSSQLNLQHDEVIKIAKIYLHSCQKLFIQKQLELTNANWSVVTYLLQLYAPNGKFWNEQVLTENHIKELFLPYRDLLKFMLGISNQEKKPVTNRKKIFNHSTGTLPVYITANNEAYGANNINENPKRIQQLKLASFKDFINVHLIENSTPPKELFKIHDKKHINAMENAAQLATLLGFPIAVDAMPWDDQDIPETFVDAITLNAAYQALNAVLGATEQLIMDQKTRAAFCLIRPPGHHATFFYADGFCIFNNAAAAALRAESLGKKVLIIDIDIHEGNGTKDIIQRLKSNIFLLNFNSEQTWPDYKKANTHPETLDNTSIINAVLPAKSSDKEIIHCIKHVATELCTKIFIPDFIIVSNGFDGHEDDVIAEEYHWKISSKGFANIYQAIADSFANASILGILEGGYNPKANAAALTEVFLQLKLINERHQY